MIVRSTDVRAALRRRQAMAARAQRGFFTLPGGMGLGPPGAAALTWNSSDKDADVTLLGGDLIASVTYPSGLGGVRATTSRDASLNSFAEVIIAGTDITQLLGIGKAGSSLNYPGEDTNGVGHSVGGNSVIYNAFVTISPYWTTQATVLGVLVDFTAGTLTFRRSGQFYAASYSSGITGTLYPMWAPGTGGAGARSGTLNTGGSAFALGLPPGATAWGGTWNSADKAVNLNLTGSDLIATVGSAGIGSVRGTQGRSSGKYYFEITYGGPDAVSLGGLGNSSASLSQYPGANANSWGFFYFDNTKYANAVNTAMPGKVTTLPVGIWLNAGVLKYVIDNQIGQDARTGLSGAYFPMWAGNTTVSGTRTGTLNTGTLVNDLPSGATQWS
jgi:hypothetical protein